MPAKEEARSAPAPTKAMVNNWDYPQYAQQRTEDIAKNKWINQKVHRMAAPLVHDDDTFGRRASAPTAAMVNNWNYPQFA
jgi:hypothetical protein